ncbi:MAG: putative deoxyuridine 5'-triphosphate nucleotidohydrolase [Prokaryotic dsDNA virus sp.]|nr:MAG: putative deoxyuridine 5'-triphosphate nucleotidohydrolase [Prokaryotic dsDNA virus sp.]|tara:strand:+ start:271 stop:792 length:522 start_codon:yes stop_codon:yes gene_type:complete
MILEYCMTHFAVNPPTRANPSDAGLDIYYSPKSRQVKTIEPGESVLLETGLRFGVPHGYMLEVKNRSSVASKRSLLVGACVIDSGYDGEVFVNLHNVGKNTQLLEPGQKIAQVVMVPVVPFRAYCRHEGNLYDYPITMSERGEGALGSTDETSQMTLPFEEEAAIDPFDNHLD